MKIENLIRYAPLAVGLKPSAMQGEARLCGLYRIIYESTAKSISPQRRSVRRGRFHIASRTRTLCHASIMVRFQGSLCPRRLSGAFLQ